MPARVSWTRSTLSSCAAADWTSRTSHKQKRRRRLKIHGLLVSARAQPLHAESSRPCACVYLSMKPAIALMLAVACGAPAAHRFAIDEAHHNYHTASGRYE